MQRPDQRSDPPKPRLRPSALAGKPHRAFLRPDRDVPASADRPAVSSRRDTPLLSFRASLSA